MNRPLTTLILIVVFVFGTAVACSGTRVRSGEVGVRVVDLGAHAGVQEHELGVGWYFPQPGSYVLKFPTTTRTEVWADNTDAIGPAIQFNNADGVPTLPSRSSGFQHVGTEIFFYQPGTSQYMVCFSNKTTEDSECRLKCPAHFFSI